MFDARPEAFGSLRVLDEIRAGRFGRVYRAQEPATGAVLLVRAFDRALPPDQARAVAAALERLCRAPLDHPSILAPVAAGLEGDLPWIAEPQVTGESLDRAMRREAARPLSEKLLRITQLAGALDFAAAAGVRHGALHGDDVVVSGEMTLVAGLGLQQALGDAGLDAPMLDDIRTLAAIACELLAGVDSAPVRGVLATAMSADPGDRPASALEFAASLQRALVAERAAVTDEQAPTDLPLRDPQSAVRDPQSAIRNPPSAMRDPDFAVRQPRTADRGERIASSVWPPMAAMLAIGLLGGFAAGFVVGQRAAIPTPYSAERAVRRPDVPAPTGGRDFTDSTVRSEVKEPDVRIPAEPERPERSDPRERPERSERFATLRVDSRPRGARVFLDGRLVGQTPLSLPEVAPGGHAVRIDLIGYQRWVTTVTVAPGEQTRVAASLER